MSSDGGLKRCAPRIRLESSTLYPFILSNAAALPTLSSESCSLRLLTARYSRLLTVTNCLTGVWASTAPSIVERALPV